MSEVVDGWMIGDLHAGSWGRGFRSAWLTTGYHEVVRNVISLNMVI